MRNQNCTKYRKQKLMLTVIKVLGMILCVLVVIILITVSALLYFENHDYSDINGLDKKEFSCYRGDLEIRGTVFMPSGQTDLPIAIVCHEFMTNRLFSYPYAMTLAKSGYAAFCFDFCGGGIMCSSDGDSRDMSVLTEIEDLKSVITFAKEQSYTNNHGDRDNLVNISGSKRLPKPTKLPEQMYDFRLSQGASIFFLTQSTLKWQ